MQNKQHPPFGTTNAWVGGSGAGEWAWMSSGSGGMSSGAAGSWAKEPPARQPSLPPTSPQPPPADGRQPGLGSGVWGSAVPRGLPEGPLPQGRAPVARLPLQGLGDGVGVAGGRGRQEGGRQPGGGGVGGGGRGGWGHGGRDADVDGGDKNLLGAVYFFELAPARKSSKNRQCFLKE